MDLEPLLEGPPRPLNAELALAWLEDLPMSQQRL